MPVIDALIATIEAVPPSAAHAVASVVRGRRREAAYLTLIRPGGATITETALRFGFTYSGQVLPGVQSEVRNDADRGQTG